MKSPILVFLFFIYTSAYAKPITVTITSPIGTLNYVGGQEINYSGMATDSLDGDLPASAFTWYVVFHHNDHSHDGPPIAKKVKNGTYVISQTNELDPDVYYLFRLIVKNSRSQTDTSDIAIYPKHSHITVNTDPPGLDVSFFSSTGTFIAPQTREVVQNMFYGLYVDKEQTLNGESYLFSNWDKSNCNTSNQFYTPSNDSSVTAYFVKKELLTISSSIASVSTVTTLAGEATTITSCNTRYGSTITSAFCNALKDTLTTCSQEIIATATQNENGLQWKVFPNPVDKVLNISLGTNALKVEIKLLDESLKEKIALDLTNDTESNYSFSTSAFPNGFYILKFSTERINTFRKIFIQH